MNHLTFIWQKCSFIFFRTIGVHYLALHPADRSLNFTKAENKQIKSNFVSCVGCVAPVRTSIPNSYDDFS